MQRYESFQTEFVHTYDKSNENHEAVFRSLFELVHDESTKQQADETMRTIAWKDMGFQKNVSTILHAFPYIWKIFDS